MGHCLSSPGGSKAYATDARADKWRATGLVGLRDAGLKSLPAAVATLGPAAKVLDAGKARAK